MKTYRRAIALVLLSIGMLACVIVASSPLWRKPGHLGRLVFTDYQPNSGFTVDLFDLEGNTRTSLQSIVYRNIGYLSSIDASHTYASVCFGRNNSMFCSASVNDILSPEQVNRFDAVSRVWKENYGSPVWSPDGSHIAFLVIYGGTQNQPGYYYDTYVMNADGTKIRDLTPDEDNNGYSFTCHNNQILCIANADGRLLQQISVIPNSEIRDLAWSPDRTQIAFSLYDMNLRSFELYIINADGSQLRRLLAAGANDHENPIWSPDGSKIVFRSGEQRNNIGEIYVINSDGTNLHNLSQSLNGSEFGPTWSPDSTNVAFFSRQGQAGTFLYIASANGTGLLRITDNYASNLLHGPSPDLFWLP
jgi:Tol biopolymer transport system component